MNGQARNFASIFFLAGLAVILFAIFNSLPFGGSPMQVGQEIAAQAGAQTGAANIVSAILLSYRGFDTLGEVSILFVAASAVGMVMTGAAKGQAQGTSAGFILKAGAYLLFPFLLTLGAYIVIHGHLTPGGGFQGGAIFAAAFFIPQLANPASPINHTVATLVEGVAGLSFIVIGLASLFGGEAFLVPLFGAGTLGEVFSAGSLPLLYKENYMNQLSHEKE